MQNKPNFQKSQMFITLMKAAAYNENLKLDTWSKRTQTNPILPVIAGKIVPSAHVLSNVEVVEGPIKTTIRRRRIQREHLLVADMLTIKGNGVVLLRNDPAIFNGSTTLTIKNNRTGEFLVRLFRRRSRQVRSP